MAALQQLATRHLLGYARQTLGRRALAAVSYGRACRALDETAGRRLVVSRPLSTGSKRPSPPPHGSSPGTLLLLGPDGTALGRHGLAAAQQLAEERGLLLVEVSSAPNHVCRLMSREQLQQAEREAKHKEGTGRAPSEHELRLSGAITQHDLETKARKLAQLLAQGSRVNIVIQKKSGQPSDAMSHFNLVRQLEQLVQGSGRLAKAAKTEGSRTTATFVPTKA